MQTAEINSIETALRELAPLIAEVQRLLESGVDGDRASGDPVAAVVQPLATIRGTLQLLELHGASVLAREMGELAASVTDGRVTDIERALEVLLEAVLKLPDYLDRIRAGRRDTPGVLLPLINDLRSVRAESALDDSALFFPTIPSLAAPSDGAGDGPSDERMRAAARRLRGRFQRALLGWYRGGDAERHLEELGAVLQELAEIGANPAAQRLWRVCGALIGSLADQGLEADQRVKMLMAKVERLLSELVRDGAEALERDIPLDLLRNLLYYVARSASDSAAVRAVKEAYQLDELLPDSAARADFEGPNRELLGAVGDGIRADLAQVKDAVEIYVHSDARRPDILDGLPERLKQVADTFSMLGLAGDRETLRAEAEALADLGGLDGNDSERRLQALADVLLQAESHLAELQSGRAREPEAAPVAQRPLAVRALPDSEFQPLVAAVVAASLDDLSKVREAVSMFCSDPDADREIVSEIPPLLAEVEGAVTMLPLDRALPLVQGLREYAERELVEGGRRPDEGTQVLIADIVAGLEYYLEAVSHDRAGMTHLLEGAVRAQDALRSGGAPEVYDEDEEVVIEAPDDGPDDVPNAGAFAGFDAGALEADDVTAATDEEYVIEAPVNGLADDAVDSEAFAGPDAEASGDADEAAGFTDEYVIEAPAEDRDDAPDTATPAHGDESAREASGATSSGVDTLADVPDEELRIEPTGDHPGASEAGTSADFAPDFPQPPGTASPDADGGGGFVADAAAPLDAGDLEAVDFEIDWSAGGAGQEGAADRGDADAEPAVGGGPGEIPGDDAEAEPAAPADGAHGPSMGPGAGPAAPGLAAAPAQPDMALAPRPEDAGGGVDPEASGSRFAIVGDDVDEEIVEVYIEEALGELDKINECLPRWRADPHDEDALVIVRRAYHTLKGGGRLIGAELVGEFSWAMESLLNRVLDHSVPASAAIFDTLDEASAALPQLVEQIQGNRAPIEGIDDLIERARALGRGEPPPDGPGNRPGPAAAPLRESAAGSRSDDTPAGGTGSPHASVPGEVEVPGDAPGDPAAHGDGHPDSEVLEPAIATGGEESGRNGPDDGADGDQTLLQIFAREAQTHQDVLRGAFGGTGEPVAEMPVREDVRRALHTLVGSAQTARVEPVAELAGEMEEIARARREAGGRLQPVDVGLFREGIAVIDGVLADLPGTGGVEIADIRERLQGQRQRVVADVRATADRQGENELLDIFLGEGDELLEQCDRAVARWRQQPDDREPVSELQRNLHTLKGGARMAHFPSIADLTHEFESVINAVANGGCSLDEDAFDLMQEAVDALTILLEQARGRQPVARVDWLVEDLRTLHEQASVPAPAPASPAPRADHEDDETNSSGTPGHAPVGPDVDNPGAGDGEGGDSKAGDGGADAVPAGAQPGADQVRVQSELLDNLVNFAGEVSIYHSRLGEQMGQYRFNLNEFEQTVSRLRSQLRTMENETESQILYRHQASPEVGPDAATPTDPERAREDDFDPLEFDRYTRLQELSRSLSESVGDLDSIKEILDTVTRDAETLLLQQSRVSSELQDGLMQTRMVRFDGLRGRLARIVRQTAGQLGKKAQLTLAGGALEIDRTVQERIVAPLEHILRNAVSHGLETPAERGRVGKPEQGSIRLDLHRGGTDVVIEITDDGRGIDPAAVRRRGIERGLIGAGDAVDDSEVIKLILETGFSTADEVTQISGRGVGMDVVDAEIRRLGGTLGIHTELGAGTRFSVRLPLTLSINQAVMVGAGEDTYAIPIASVEGVAQVTAGELKPHYVDPSKPFAHAGAEYRLEHLGTLLGTSEPRLDTAEISYPVIMIRTGDERIALHVDQLVGRREVVVKPLGPPLNELSGLSGATIMPDGQVILILDVGGLLRSESRFVATGTLHQPGDDVPDAGDAPAPDGEAAPTVLVVDDSITIRKVTQRILARNGIRVATAKDGIDALSWMAHSVPDLILLDIEMPRMDGYEVANYVRGEPRLARIPIIMITSRTGEKHRQRAEDIGVDRYLGKPYQEADLMAHIGQLIDTPEAA